MRLRDQYLDFGSGEILYLKWEEVELESGIIKMPVRKNRRMLDAPLTVAGAEKPCQNAGLIKDVAWHTFRDYVRVQD